MRRGARLYLAANATSQGIALIRYVLLARLLGPHELGLAATLILTAAFFEAISDTGGDRFLIQNRDGDSAAMQGLVHVVMGVRGVCIAAGLILFSGLVADLYNEPALQWSLVAMGLAPLIGGLVHLDMKRVQRTDDFRSEAKVLIVAEVVGLIATATAAWMVRDHTAVVYGLVARSVVMVATSHVVAQRSYHWAFSRPEARIFGTFAAPLALNGLLVFLGTQGDRMIVGGGLGAAALGQYSAIALLIYYPAAMVGRFLSGIHLPMISREQEGDAGSVDQRGQYASRVLVLSSMMLVGFAIVGPLVVPWIYGPLFMQPVHVFALLGVLQSVRFLRLWPSNLAISVGRSGILLQNNIVRLMVLPIAFVAASHYGRLEPILAAFILGEFLALGVALILLRSAKVVALRREAPRLIAFVAVCLGIGSASWLIEQNAAWWMVSAATAIAVAAVATGLRIDRRFVWRDVQHLSAYVKRLVLR